MPGNDLLEQSLPRVELDQRSREARLRLEQVERLLLVRRLPKPSLLRRVLRRLGTKIYTGQRIEGRSARTTLTGEQPSQGRRIREQADGAAGRFPATRPNHPARAWVDAARPNPRRGASVWSYSCRRTG